MTKRFSVQTITALTEVVTGGSANDSTPAVGHYRSGPKLESFFGGLNIELRIGSASRVPSVQAVLQNAARGPDGNAAIIRVIEAVADPRDYLDEPEKLTAVVVYMNKRLSFDGHELRRLGNVYKVVTVTTNTVAASALQEKAKALDLGSVHADFERALSEADRDPADAITSACSTVESVCKCILDEMGKAYPVNKDIKGLVTEVAKHLKLSPGRDDLPKVWEQDIRQVLSGLFSVVGGIGALRTHAGDAHGKGKDHVPVDSRIARLAIHAASTVSLFYIETWQKVAGHAKINRARMSAE
ncbi:MAG: abortive infection family protein [Pirellulales bacterium]|nr:abortive infection family protein [Pirellulales bacterium]